MGLQRNGNMIMARLNHTPSSRHFYQWADENGSLIIAEIPNWQIPPVLLTNARLKELFRLQMEEMVESYWNSPSIIAWSMGNEYSSWTPEGDEWTRCQAENCRQLDTTRLITFISHKPAADPKNISVPHDSYRYCDFLCINIYTDFPTFDSTLKNLHQKYPEKPIFISECGLRADQVESEQQRIDHLKGLIDLICKKPYVTGFSYWSFNDYLSRFTNTNPSGYREWGVVDANRKPRGLYQSFQTELSPVTVGYDKGMLNISTRADFPSYTLKNFKLVLSSGTKILKEYPLPVLNPGESTTIKMAKPSATTMISVTNSKGFKVFESGLKQLTANYNLDIE
jgi:beta-glucuronidase